MMLPNDLIRLFGISLNAKSTLAISSWYRAMLQDRYLTIQIQRLTIDTRTPDGCPNGIIFDYYHNGQVFERYMVKDGRVHGCYENWHHNGNQEIRSYYKNGRKNGIETRWIWDGHYTSRCSYKDGKQHGYSVIIDLGKLTVEKYVDGKQIGINISDLDCLFA